MRIAKIKVIFLWICDNRCQWYLQSCLHRAANPLQPKQVRIHKVIILDSDANESRLPTMIGWESRKQSLSLSIMSPFTLADPFFPVYVFPAHIFPRTHFTRGRKSRNKTQESKSRREGKRNKEKEGFLMQWLPDEKTNIYLEIISLLLNSPRDCTLQGNFLGKG